mgnify:CR=1 FL=1
MKSFTLFTLTALIMLVASCNYQKDADIDAVEVEQQIVEFRDFGPEPFVFDIEEYTIQNNSYRQALWTGTKMQLTLMSLQPGEKIDLELHSGHDQFIRIESGKGKILMGDSKENLDFEVEVEDDFGIFIPAGKWHTLINTSDKPLKLYSIYTPIEHQFGTVHQTYKEAQEAEHDHPHD